jgi:hypothetical protein
MELKRDLPQITKSNIVCAEKKKREKEKKKRRGRESGSAFPTDVVGISTTRNPRRNAARQWCRW